MLTMDRLARGFEALAELADAVPTHKDELVTSVDETSSQALYDLAEILGWDWEHDKDFMRYCEKATPVECWRKAAVTLKKKHDTPKLIFVHLSRAWYGPANLQSKQPRGAPVVDEVYFSHSHPEGGIDHMGEAGMKWLQLRDGEPPCPWLEFASDSWKLAAHMAPLIANLARNHHGSSIQPLAFCDFLKMHGFKDTTEEKRPHNENLKIIRCPECAAQANLSGTDEDEWDGACNGRPAHGLTDRKGEGEGYSVIVRRVSCPTR